MGKIFSMIFILTLLPVSCTEKEDVKIDPDNLILGTWTYAEGHEDVRTYSRGNDFVDNHCYRFNTDGSMIERNIAGWCGTPPVSYSDYNGTWNIVNDDLIRVNVEYWGGMREYSLEIISVTRDSLKIKYVTVQ